MGFIIALYIASTGITAYQFRFVVIGYRDRYIRTTCPEGREARMYQGLIKVWILISVCPIINFIVAVCMFGIVGNLDEIIVGTRNTLEKNSLD